MSRRLEATSGSDLQVLVTAGVLLAVPLIGLSILFGAPEWDGSWEHHPAHFWLVLAVAAMSAVLAYGTGAAALRCADARVLLVSLAFLSAAGFLGLHALATPGVLLDTPNTGFTIATPVGLGIGAVLAVMSGVDMSRERAAGTIRLARQLRVGLVAAMVAWAVASLSELPPLDATTPPEQATGALLALPLVGVALYAMAAVRYLMLWREHHSVMLLGMSAAFVLLGEAMVAVTFAPNWHATWWEWHVLMLLAFGLVAWSAQRQWHEERFADLYLPDTVAGVRDMSILFADLKGFTRFSEQHEARDVTAMLNTYFKVAVPLAVERFGGDVDRIIGDAVMVTFNRRGDQPDHPQRAAAAALALQAETAKVASINADWPRFRVGINSGEASVSLLGAEGGRTHTVIGDVVNVASRLEGLAPVGGVAVSAETISRLDGAHTQPLGFVDLKGRTEPLEVFLLLAIGGNSGNGA